MRGLSIPGRGWSAAVGSGVLAAVLAGCGPAPRWYKGNLHTHSYWSDGDQFPEVILQGYRERGYDFVAISDHNELADTERWVTVSAIPNGERSLAEYLRAFGEPWVEQRDSSGQLQVRLKRFAEYAARLGEPGRFLVVRAEEITDRFDSRPLHVNATNVRDFIPPQGGVSVADVLQRNIAAVLAQRQATGQPMFPHVNHPNFGWAVTAEDLMGLEGERFFEVYNGHPLVHNDGDSLHPSTDRLWDIVLAHRLTRGLGVVYGLAVDDAHNYERMDSTEANPARGWVMVRARELSADAVIAALEAGAFYASTGVVLEDIRVSSERLRLVIAGDSGVDYVTEFVGTRAGFDARAEDVAEVEGLPVTRRYKLDIGAVLSTVEGLEPAYQFRGDELYVRARIRSTRPVAHPVRAGEVERAWVQPVVVRQGGG
ncbi:MAG TPA: hypothetical protein VNL18_07505 [Gemmatimonadales bacterium]|nr:hypothetical protein [Gemmatimonadales bacterium]